MLQSQMLQPPYDVSYLRRISENWRHRRGLWQMLVAVTYRTGPVRCNLLFYVNYSALPARPPYGDRTATVRCPYVLQEKSCGDRIATVRSPYDVKIVVPKSYGDSTATARRPYGVRTIPSDIRCKDNPAATVR